MLLQSWFGQTYNWLFLLSASVSVWFCLLSCDPIGYHAATLNATNFTWPFGCFSARAGNFVPAAATPNPRTSAWGHVATVFCWFPTTMHLLMFTHACIFQLNWTCAEVQNLQAEAQGLHFFRHHHCLQCGRHLNIWWRPQTNCLHACLYIFILQHKPNTTWMHSRTHARMDRRQRWCRPCMEQWHGMEQQPWRKHIINLRLQVAAFACYLQVTACTCQAVWNPTFKHEHAKNKTKTLKL